MGTLGKLHRDGDTLAGGAAAPLCVDMDGTLLSTDVLLECAVRYVKPNPLRAFKVFGWALRGPAHLKAQLARHVELDVSALPVNGDLLDWLRSEHRGGRRLVLCTAANERVAGKVAAHFGIFSGVLASDEHQNLSGRAKAQRLIQQYGRGGFDYVGNELKDVHVWSQSRRAIAVAPPRMLRRLEREPIPLERSFLVEPARASDWVRALRLHQWSKNLLLFVPLLAAHRWFDLTALSSVMLSFLLFGLCASGTYLINDMLDLDADRRHPRKSSRPLAAGRIALIQGIAVAGACVGGSLLVAAILLPPLFTAALLVYLATTLWYSIALKRIAMVDALSLAGLYTIRIFAGGAAAAVIPSFWLLAFSMFLFLSLAAAKRYAELRLMLESGRQAASGRGYTVEDLPLLHSCGIASGYLAVLVFALYVNSGAAGLYERPQLMWLTCPLLLYWVSRVWLKTFRGQMHDDPVVFALTDRPSVLVGALSAVLIALAV